MKINKVGWLANWFQIKEKIIDLVLIMKVFKNLLNWWKHFTFLRFLWMFTEIMTRNEQRHYENLWTHECKLKLVWMRWLTNWLKKKSHTCWNKDNNSTVLWIWRCVRRIEEIKLQLATQIFPYT